MHTRLARRLSGRTGAALRAALVVALAAGARAPASAGEDAESLYRAALRTLAKKERVFWEEFRERQEKAQEVAREPWREMVRAMNGNGARFDREFDHSAFRSLYDDHARLERERLAAATALATAQGGDSLRTLWSELLATCEAIDVAEAQVEAINDPAGDTWAGTDQGPGLRRHGLQIRLEGLTGALALLRETPGFLVATGWKEATKGDSQRSITRRVAVLDLLAASRSRDGVPVAEQALAEKWSSVRVASLECALQLDPAPRPALLACLRDRSAPVRRAALAGVRLRAPQATAWIPPFVERLPETEGLERLECLATLSALAGRDLGPAPEAWRAWCEAHRAAIGNGTFRPDSDRSVEPATFAPLSTTSFFGVTPLSDGIIFALDGGDNLLVPADYEVQRTRAFLSWISGKQGWRKDHPTHREVLIREFSGALGRLGPRTGFAVLFCTDNADVKIMGDRRLLRGGTRDTQKAVAFLEAHAPRGYRSEFADLRTALGLAGLPVPGFDFPEPVADTILFVGDGSLRGGPYLVPDAAALALARWNRFRRVAIHTIRICNAGPDSELLMRRLAEVGGGTYQWRRTPP